MKEKLQSQIDIQEEASNSKFSICIGLETKETILEKQARKHKRRNQLLKYMKKIKIINKFKSSLRVL